MPIANPINLLLTLACVVPRCECAHTAWTHFPVASQIHSIWSQLFSASFQVLLCPVLVCRAQNNLLCHWRFVLGPSFNSWNSTKFVLIRKMEI